MITRALKDLYARQLRAPDAMARHMHKLCDLAAEYDRVAEIGIRRGSSTLALLAGCPGEVWSCDIEELPVHSVIANAVGEGARQNRWRRWYVPSEEWEWPAENVGLLCIDGYHTYSQVQAELIRFADRVTGTLVFHDTMSCGIKGDGIANRAIHSSEMMDDEKGIRLAIDELMMRDPSWRIASHAPYASGLLVLRRAPQ